MKKNAKNKNSRIETLDPKKKRQRIIIASVFGLVLVALLVYAIAAPYARINSGLSDIIKTVRDMDAPTLVITDMKNDNVFSDSAGEVMINDADQTGALLSELCELSERMKYSGKNTDIFSAWDIRLTVTDGESRAILYLAENKIYYAVGSVEYYFVPKDSETEKDYGELYGEITKLLDAGE